MADARKVPHQTKMRQAVASDPRLSVWVSANAGSGKTFILAQRVIRLLLDGVEPARILCLTYTKAAAAQMSNRVFETLAEWTRKDDAELGEILMDITGYRPEPALLRHARTLFALSLDTPGGLKIQTIHAFCEALLHQFPLEAELPSHFEVIEEDVQNQLIEQANREILSGLHKGQFKELSGAFRELLAAASDQAISEALAALTDIRHKFRAWTALAEDVPLSGLRRAMGVAEDENETTLARKLAADSALHSADMSKLADAACYSDKQADQKFAAGFDKFRQAEDPLEQVRIRNDLFLTAQQTPRKHVATKAILARFPDLAPILAQERERAAESVRQMAQIRILRASNALFMVGGAILDRYDAIKRRNGLSDFEDLIQVTARLLTRADIRGWVQYKLDQGIDHVLIDEAQDTSPMQWEIVNALVEEFFAGEGSSPRNRTLFAVGDEKQSIYSFQGAEPLEFGRQAANLKRRAKAGGRAFEHVKLHLSFRSTPEVLQAVDKVFSVAENARGLGEGAAGLVHEALRKEAGEVQIWPLFKKQPVEKPTSWLAPVDTVRGNDPAVDLARNIAQTVRGWIDNDEMLPCQSRPVRCGDVLILVRRRDRFVNAVIREMKSLGLAVAGADRLVLTEHIAVEDLIALGRFALFPEDDLSLAAALKSPLFGFDDEELTRLAAQRGGISLMQRMREVAQGSGEWPERVRQVRERLEHYRRSGCQSRPFEFYSRILGGDGGRRVFRAQLGGEVDDVLDAFLQAAIHHERAGGLNLEGFIAALTASPPEIKREIDTRRDEVRVITVHAAKGLEAPIVFLVDPCTPAFIAAHRPKIVEVEESGAKGLLWQPPGSKHVGAIERANLRAELAAEEEYRRLLYVAMTRAKDRLIVCGWRGLIEYSTPYWHAMISDAIAEEAQPFELSTGLEALVWRRKTRTPGPAAEPRHLRETKSERPIPDWLTRAVESESGEKAAVSPSLAAKDAGVSDRSAKMGTGRADPATAREQGTAIHALLQYLPQIEISQRREAGLRYLERTYPKWRQQDREQLSRQANDLISNRDLAMLFGPGSKAEVTVATTEAAGFDGRPITGQIDRLVELPDRIVIADFKSDGAVPRTEADLPASYVLQLALYRRAIRAIFPGKPVQCMLVWTRDNSHRALSDGLMNRALETMTSA